MATICIGIPILWTLWRHTLTRYLFFQGLAVAMLWEWMRMTNTYRLWWTLLLLHVQNRELFLTAVIAAIALDQILLGSGQQQQQQQQQQRQARPEINTPAEAKDTLLSQQQQRDHRPSSSSSHAFATGCLLIIIPSYSWLQVQQQEKVGFYHVISLLLITWNVDTGSLIAGRLTPRQYLGQPAWLTRLSPGKTVAGLVGGLMGGTCTCVWLLEFWRLLFRLHWISSPQDVSLIELEQRPTLQAVAIGISLSLAASLGDLWESSLKRHYQVKDTSQLLPGHGGVLDRFDSSLVAVMLYEYYIRQGWV
jgi:hypothetical protein